MIGSLREKGSIIEQGVVARLLQILKAPDSDIQLKTEITTVLNSLAKGLPHHAGALVQAGLLPVLWERKSIRVTVYSRSIYECSISYFRTRDMRGATKQ